MRLEPELRDRPADDDQIALRVLDVPPADEEVGAVAGADAHEPVEAEDPRRAPPFLEDPDQLDKVPHHMRGHDPTIYARVDYLDPKAKISDAEKASCRAILKNLPVIFTFAPMNLLHYRVKFGAGSTNTVMVEYQQFAYADTRGPKSYQLAYVLHPASLWDDFGPINLEVIVPEGVAFRASFLIDKDGKDKFLQTYKKLKNSSDKTVQQRNVKKLERIYRKSLRELEQEWERVFTTANSK